MKNFKTLAITHKTINLKDLGRFVLDEIQLKDRLTFLKTASKIDEIFYLATCNRVEFFIATENELTLNFLEGFFRAFKPEWNETEIDFATKSVTVFEGEKAVEHLFRVASSLDSLVVGEKEIFGQLRKAYNTCTELGLTGDTLRLVMDSAVKTSKEVFSQTKIAQKPVSIVSLAFRKIKDLKNSTKFLIVGAGQTNTLMAKYLLKHGFKNFTVFNRTLGNAEILAKKLNGKALPLSELANCKETFDVIITCTGASEPVLTYEIYSKLVKNDTSKKIIIDLAVPNDLDTKVLENFNISFIGIEQLQSVAKQNLQERKEELTTSEKIISANLEEFKTIHHKRKITLAMREVPQKIKEIKLNTLNSVFAKEIGELDQNSKEILNKVLDYFEKKCVGIPMVVAKEVFAKGF